MKIDARKRKQLSLGICDNGPWPCLFMDTIDSESACRKPPIFEKCPHQIMPDEIEWI